MTELGRNVSKTILLPMGLAALMACQSASSDPRQAIDAGTLIDEYDKTRGAVRRKYDGKEILVRGYTESIAAMPNDKNDQGSVALRDRQRRLTGALTCWFSREQVGEFSKIKGNQDLTVRGVFTGEAGAELKFCKLIKLE